VQAYEHDLQNYHIYYERLVRAYAVYEDLAVFRTGVGSIVGLLCLQRKSTRGLERLPKDVLRMIGPFLIPKVQLSFEEVKDMERWMEDWEISGFWEGVYLKYRWFFD
jgi:hypothetical protein